MELKGINIFLEKTLVIGTGDKITNCNITYPKTLSPYMEVPEGVTDYDISYNHFEPIEKKPKHGFVFSG